MWVGIKTTDYLGNSILNKYLNPKSDAKGGGWLGFEYNLRENLSTGSVSVTRYEHHAEMGDVGGREVGRVYANRPTKAVSYTKIEEGENKYKVSKTEWTYDLPRETNVGTSTRIDTLNVLSGSYEVETTNIPECGSDSCSMGNLAGIDPITVSYTENKYTDLGSLENTETIVAGEEGSTTTTMEIGFIAPINYQTWFIRITRNNDNNKQCE